MKRSIHDLVGCRVHSEDGDLGRVEEFYFDDHKWVIRYMVVNTGRWLQSRRVLISTAALMNPEWKSRAFPVALTRQQVKNSPSTDTDKPVSRQHEAELLDYYNWPIYWGLGLERYAGGGYPVSARQVRSPVAEKQTPKKLADPNLRSTRRVTGYSIQAVDGEIGHVHDFIVDDETWAIRYVVVNTQNWLPGKKVLVFAPWISRVSWDESKIYVDLSRELIETSPPLDLSKPLSRAYEEQLFDHYGRSKYWEKDKADHVSPLQAVKMKRKTLHVSSLIVELGNSSATVREEARRSLTAIGKAAVKPLVVALANANGYGRGQAAKALGEIGDPSAAPALAEALEDERLDVRWLAARGLEALGQQGLPALLEALVERPDSIWLREGAYHILHDEGYEPWREQLGSVMKALEGYAPADTLPDAAREALQALGTPSYAAKD